MHVNLIPQPDAAADTNLVINFPVFHTQYIHERRTIFSISLEFYILSFASKHPNPG